MKAIAIQTIGVDSRAPGALMAVSAGDVHISFSSLAPDFPPVKARTAVDFEETTGRGMEHFGDVWSARLQGFPRNPANVILTFTVEAQKGGSLVVDTLQDGTLIGDIVVGESSLNWQTGEISFKFLEPVLNRKPVILRVRHPGTPRPEERFELTGVPYDGQKVFAFQIGTKPNVNQPLVNPAGRGIAPGTVRLSAQAADGRIMRVIDDGHGRLVGDIEPQTGEETGIRYNFINYATGSAVVMFANPVEHNMPVGARFGVMFDVTLFREMPQHERVTVSIKYEDLRRIVHSAELTMDAEQAAMQFSS